MLKRTGREVPFDPGKIERAIAAAGQVAFRGWIISTSPQRDVF
ncbi:ATP cone domain-containing protein [Pseudomonas aeruginosa]